MPNKNSKNQYLLTAVATLLVITIGFTAAYFQAQIASGATANVTVTTKTTDLLTFNKGNDISITATQANFYSGAGNRTGSTTATATLLANNDTNSATQTYNVYLLITNNNFVYTTDPTNTPELMLTITNPNNQAVTTLTGLTYTTSGGVSGFDITTKSGLIQIASNYTITSTGTKTDTWNITVTLVNLNSDQQLNTGKTFTGRIIIQKKEYRPLLSEKVINNWISNSDSSIIIKHDGTVLDGSNNVLDAEDNSYRYTGGDYDVTQTAISAGYSYVNTYYNNTTGGVIGVNCNGTNRYIGYSDSSCSTKYYYLLYDTNVTQYSTYDAALAKAITDGYIVARNLNNYVCFGYDTSVAVNETTCPEQNLYRIIGAFDDDNDGNYNAKLIKADYASTTEFGTNAQNGISIKADHASTTEFGTNGQNGTSSYAGDYTSSQYTGYRGTISLVNQFIWSGDIRSLTNRWDNSTFRTGVLNNYYLNTYLNGNDTKWKNMLEESTYYLGGPDKTGYTDYKPKSLYNTERTAEAVYDTTTYPASIDNYIGLMYISDYGYASKTSTWSEANTFIRASGNDWIYNGIYEWTITPNSWNKRIVVSVRDLGSAYSYEVTFGYAVRPVMYLDSGVEVLRGLGTKASPYYIGLPT